MFVLMYSGYKYLYVVKNGRLSLGANAIRVVPNVQRFQHILKAREKLMIKVNKR